MPEDTRLQNVFYQVADMARARRFYEPLLNPTLKFADGDRWVQYVCGGGKFALGGPTESHTSMSGAAIIFEVPNIGTFEDRVSGAGGKVLGFRDMGSHGATLIVSDPDGNVVYLWTAAAK